MDFIESSKMNFNAVADHVLGLLQPGEELNLNLAAEDSLFLRFNGNKIRQNTAVEQRTLSLKLQKNRRTYNCSFSVTGDTAADKVRAEKMLAEARQECELLPEDPYQVPMQNNGQSDETVRGSLIPETEIAAAITEPAQGTDLAGLYSAGALISANRNSLGQSHWFANENFFFDYSLYLGEKAVKGIYAGTAWDQKAFARNLAHTKEQLSLMDRPKKEIAPGQYRTYLAPGAVTELAGMFMWGAVSFSSYKQGASALMKLANKEAAFSPQFNLRENFAMGLTHRFNGSGELAPEKLNLISEGRLQNFLISTRSAKEYGVESNKAVDHESPRALEILTGSLKQEDILKELGTGLYLSNLHYLNWSDRPGARITGMTRYACFWVENGQIVGPIKDLRFDESLYDCLGENLLAITDFAEIEPNTDTYNKRSFGGKKVPGMLIKDFKFTL